MAVFTDAAAPPGESTGKWKPGGRGRPPKGSQPAAAPAPDREPDDDLPGNGERAEEYAPAFSGPTAATSPGHAAALELRRNPATYPRYSSGLPIPLYRVTRTEDDLHCYLNAMRPEDWGHCEMYVYKYYPREMRRQDGNQYIDKITEGPVDLSKFIEQNGSGVYGFTLNDSNIQGRKRTVMYARVDLSRDDVPEKFDLSNLDVHHTANKQLVARLIREGVLNHKGEIMQSENGNAAAMQQLTAALVDLARDKARTPPAPPPDPNAAAMAKVHETTVTMLMDANKAALNAATAGAKPNSTGDVLQLVTTIAGLVAPKQPEGDSPTLKLLMEELKMQREAAKQAAEAAEKERQRNHELQMAALQQKAQQADPLDQIEKVMKIKNLLGGDIGAAAAPRNWKEQAIGMVSDHLPQILEIGGALVQRIGKPQPVTADMVAGMGQGAGQPQPGGVVDTTATAANNPPQLPPGGGGGAGGAGGAADGGQQPGDLSQLTDDQRRQIARIQTLQQQIAEHGRFLVNAISRGQDGYTFAESLVNMTDELTYERARAYSLEEWQTAIFSFPELRQRFAGVEHTVTQFIAEFLDWGNGEDGEADGEADGDGGNTPGTPSPAAAAAPAATASTTASTRKRTASKPAAGGAK